MNKPNWTTAPAVVAVDKMRGQSLWPTAAELKRVPELYATEDTPTDDKLVVLHYFCGSADWWIVEMDSEGLAFGYACLGNPEDAEWGYVTIEELASLQVSRRMVVTQAGGPAKHLTVPIVVERDAHWTPVKVSECRGLQAVRNASRI